MLYLGPCVILSPDESVIRQFWDNCPKESTIKGFLPLFFGFPWNFRPFFFSFRILSVYCCLLISRFILLFFFASIFFIFSRFEVLFPDLLFGIRHTIGLHCWIALSFRLIRIYEILVLLI